MRFTITLDGDRIATTEYHDLAEKVARFFIPDLSKADLKITEDAAIVTETYSTDVGDKKVAVRITENKSQRPDPCYEGIGSPPS